MLSNNNKVISVLNHLKIVLVAVSLGIQVDNLYFNVHCLSSIKNLLYVCQGILIAVPTGKSAQQHK